MKSLKISISSLFLLLGFCTATAVANPYSEITIGQDSKSCQAALKSMALDLQELPQNRAQSFSQAILATDYLSLMNQTGTKHKLFEADTFYLASKPKDKNFIVIAIKNNKVQSYYANYDVPVGNDPFTKSSLGSWQNLLASFSSCNLTPRSSDKNHFIFRGKCAAKNVLLQYHPENNYASAVFY